MHSLRATTPGRPDAQRSRCGRSGELRTQGPPGTRPGPGPLGPGGTTRDDRPALRARHLGRGLPRQPRAHGDGPGRARRAGPDRHRGGRRALPAAPPRPRAAARPGAHRAAPRPRRRVPRAVLARGLGHPVHRGRLHRDRDRRRLRRRMHDHRPRPHRPRWRDEPVLAEEDAACAGDRAREPAPGDQPGGVRRGGPADPGRPVRPGRADLPRADRAVVDGDPDRRAGVRQLHRRRRLRARHVRLRRDGRPAGQGVPRRPAAGEDGHRRGVRRRVARRRRDARPGVGPVRLLRRRRARRHPDRAPIVSELNWRKLGPGPTLPADEPVHDPDELLGIAPSDIKVPFDPREVIARVVDGSRFGEYKPLWGTSLVTGWASIHGYPVGILANARGVLFSEEAKKATEFILLANQTDTPLIFLQNTTGYMVGKSYEQGGIIKDGAKMINSVANSKVPHITLNLAASFGAGNYGMSGRAYDPRLMFAWPGAKLAVMGAAQLAGVMSIVARQSAASSGREFDAEADERNRAAVEAQIEKESHSFFVTARLYDDGVIDPRDTRTVLGIALSTAHSNIVAGQRGYGVFRM
ncbi:hypothetical protein L7F22_025637 [Adiantum nelumboides]|nr:hypothetical protein [Adiantum nelumboides]